MYSYLFFDPDKRKSFWWQSNSLATWCAPGLDVQLVMRDRLAAKHPASAWFGAVPIRFKNLDKAEPSAESFAFLEFWSTRETSIVRHQVEQIRATSAVAPTGLTIWVSSFLSSALSTCSKTYTSHVQAGSCNNNSVGPWRLKTGSMRYNSYLFIFGIWEKYAKCIKADTLSTCALEPVLGIATSSSQLSYAVFKKMFLKSFYLNPPID